MDAANWVQNFVAAGAKIDGLWSMYIVVQLGILWFIFLVHRPLLLAERLIALFAYGFFLFANGRSLIDAYRLCEALRADLVDHFAAGLADTPHVRGLLSSLSYADRGELILWSHGVAWIVAALLLMFRNTMVRYYARLYPEHARLPSD